MKSLWLFLKSFLYVLIVPGVLVGWLPLNAFEHHPQWDAAWGGAQWIGLIIALPGAIFYLVSVWILAARGRGTPFPFDPPQKMTRRGPYKWVRNPMYLSLFALVAGEALYLRSWHIGVYFVCLVCTVHLMVVLHEETVLRFRFGAIYEDYKRDVRRWFPRRPRPMLETVAPFDLRR